MIGEYRYKNHVLQIIDILFMKFSEASSHCYSLKDLRSCMQDILESGYHVSQYFSLLVCKQKRRNLAHSLFSFSLLSLYVKI